MHSLHSESVTRSELAEFGLRRAGDDDMDEKQIRRWIHAVELM